MFEEVENFRFEHRYQTRNQATIALIRLGLDAVREQQKQQSQPVKRA